MGNPRNVNSKRVYSGFGWRTNKHKIKSNSENMKHGQHGFELSFCQHQLWPGTFWCFIKSCFCQHQLWPGTFWCFIKSFQFSEILLVALGCQRLFPGLRWALMHFVRLNMREITIFLGNTLGDDIAALWQSESINLTVASCLDVCAKILETVKQKQLQNQVWNKWSARESPQCPQ